MTAAQRAPAPLQRIARPVWAYWRDLLTRIVEVQMVDRGVALGAQAFTAVVPLLMVVSLAAPRKESADFADSLVRRFNLSGESAAALREAFSPASTLTSQSISFIGVLLLIVAVLSFTRTLQRLYENAFVLPTMGFRGTPSGLLWIAMIAVLSTVNPILKSFVDGLIALIVAIALASLLWGATPYILTGRRITKRQAAPAGILAGVAMTALGIGSTIWFPHTVAQSAEQYGLIGVAFAFVSWLVGAGLTIAATAVAGAVLAEHLGLAPPPKPLPPGTAPTINLSDPA